MKLAPSFKERYRQVAAGNEVHCVGQGKIAPSDKQSGGDFHCCMPNCPSCYLHMSVIGAVWTNRFGQIVLVKYSYISE